MRINVSCINDMSPFDAVAHRSCVNRFDDFVVVERTYLAPSNLERPTATSPSGGGGALSGAQQYQDGFSFSPIEVVNGFDISVAFASHPCSQVRQKRSLIGLSGFVLQEGNMASRMISPLGSIARAAWHGCDSLLKSSEES
jgi:hypothetical protein